MTFNQLPNNSAMKRGKKSTQFLKGICSWSVLVHEKKKKKMRELEKHTCKLNIFSSFNLYRPVYSVSLARTTNRHFYDTRVIIYNKLDVIISLFLLADKHFWVLERKANLHDTVYFPINITSTYMVAYKLCNLNTVYHTSGSFSAVYNKCIAKVCFNVLCSVETQSVLYRL